MPPLRGPAVEYRVRSPLLRRASLRSTIGGWRGVHLELAECECEAGDLTLVVRERRLCGLVFSDHWHWMDHWLARRFGEVKISRRKIRRK